MTVPYRLLVGQQLSAAERREISAILASVFDEVDKIYNDWNPDSELSQLNILGAKEPRTLSPQLERLLLKVEEMVRLTEGRFDPTVSALQKLWRSHLEEGRIPTEEALEALRPSVGWNKIHIEGGRFWKEHAQTRLDLGGIAKGYCVDLMLERLANAGYRHCYFDWGGEIAAKGQHPSRRPWSAFISSLGSPDPSKAVATLSLSEHAVATSGDYMQYWVVDEGGRSMSYFHIVDPRTQRPLELKPGSIASVSVLDNNCMRADALATATMIFSDPQEAQSWVRHLQKTHPHLSVWIVTRGESN